MYNKLCNIIILKTNKNLFEKKMLHQVLFSDQNYLKKY